MDYWTSGPSWGCPAIAERAVAAEYGAAAEPRPRPAVRRRSGGMRRTLAAALVAVARRLDPTHAARQGEAFSPAVPAATGEA